ncbi:MAG: hypothetical protein QOH47_3088 [Sphingomonadales bacterium]|nr:hypothetical protein [Sphingomonadales bacterium]
MTRRLPILSLAALCGAGIATLAASPAASIPRQPRPLQELRCRYIEDHNGQAITLEAPGLRVLEQTAASGRFQPAVPQGVSSIMCSRTSLIPAPNDDEVLWLGMPLFIAELGSPGRLGVLEINEGSYRFRMIEGRVRPEEQAQVDARLDEYQTRFREIQQRQQARRGN